MEGVPNPSLPPVPVPEGGTEEVSLPSTGHYPSKQWNLTLGEGEERGVRPRGSEVPEPDLSVRVDPELQGRGRR